MSVAFPFSRPVYVMTKPAGSHCNLACRYCYYLEKDKLYPNDPRHTMSDELLELFTRQYIEMQAQQDVLFTWHGGETLMRPLSFYKRALELQRIYARGHKIDNCIQTNGTLITEEWARFFHDNHFLVGVSIDGPQEYHDAYRKTRLGRPSFHQVMRGIDLLNKYKVEWNALAVVNNLNGDHPQEFYRFFRSIGCHFIQFTPVVERIYRHSDGRLLASPEIGSVAEMAPFSVTPRQWGTFLIGVFNEWIKEDVGEYYVQLFDATLAGWMGVAPGLCSFGETCGHAAAMEYNGDVYACDHFVFPEYKLGNLRRNTLAEMMYSEGQQAFGASKREGLTEQCRACPWLHACHGECLRLRFGKSRTGESGHNYLCEGYLAYFRHVAPYMDFMKQQLLAGQAPARVMEWARTRRKE